MSRTSTVSAPGTAIPVHVAPPSTVRRIVPLDPLAQAIRSSTAEIPRKLAVDPLIWTIQDGTFPPGQGQAEAIKIAKPRPKPNLKRK
jgi:hypothetical protein